MKKTIALLLILFLAATNLFAQAVYPVRWKETGALFNTISEAITTAQGAGYDTFTLEVTGDVTETDDIIINTENVTIVGAEGAHTVTMSSAQPSLKFLLQGGGTLTLGNDTTTNPLTILHSVNVTNGTIHIKEGIILKSSKTLSLSGVNINGTITGGRFEGSVTALEMKNGAKLQEISGGIFYGQQEAVLLSDVGTKIEKISGGSFYQTNPSATLHGQAIFVQNESQIGEISAGYFESARSQALLVIRGAWIGKISGGEFAAPNSYDTDGNKNAAIRINGSYYPSTGIGTISGGDFKNSFFGLLSIEDGAKIGYITGGIFEGTVGIQNDTGSEITEISGGKFTGSQGMLNNNIIGKIGGNAEFSGTGSYGIFNYSGGTINEIGKNAAITGKDYGIMNSGTIMLISGGTFIGNRSAINSNGLNKGKLEKITNGIFWGKTNVSIQLGYKLTLEPELSVSKGLGRYWGKDGVIFDNDDLVEFPENYQMSTKTEPVGGIQEVEFKYLTLPVQTSEVFLEHRIVNLRYDPNVNGIVFDLELRAGSGYLETELPMTATNINIDFNFEPAVAVDFQSATRVIPENPVAITNVLLAQQTFPPHLKALDIHIQRETLGAPNDFTRTWVNVATVTLPLAAGSAVPTTESFLQFRLFGATFFDTGWGSALMPNVPFPYTISCPEKFHVGIDAYAIANFANINKTYCQGTPAILASLPTAVDNVNPNSLIPSIPGKWKVGDQYVDTVSTTTPGTTIYTFVADFPEAYCETPEGEITIIVIPNSKIRGTVFPFIYYGNPEIDKLFPVVARLYDISLLSQGPDAILAAEPIYVDTAVYYDGTEFVPNVPKYPGYLGCLSNPGSPIDKTAIGYTTTVTTLTPLLKKEKPEVSIGLYKFDGICKGEYILVLSKGGYVTRFAKIDVNIDNMFLEHRELIPGDLNGDFVVDETDILILLSRASQCSDLFYDPFFDLDGDLRIDMSDMSIMKIYMQFHAKYYQDSTLFFSE
jgi:hypothetical protein